MFFEARRVSVTLGTEIKEVGGRVGASCRRQRVPKPANREEIERIAGLVQDALGTRRAVAELWIAHALNRSPATVKTFTADGGRRIAQAGVSFSKWKSASQWLEQETASCLLGKLLKCESRIHRRGLSKLLIAGDPGSVLEGISAGLNAEEPVGKALAASGWASKSIAGWKLAIQKLLVSCKPIRK